MNNRRTSGVRAYARKALTPAAVAGVAGLAFAPQLALADDAAADALLPLYGRWSSRDGVTVSITSALTERKGAIGRCMAFAKQPSHDLWLPEFWDEGYYDCRYHQESPFDPLVWAPEIHSLGIDVGEEIAAEGPGGRPRLGIDLTKSLGKR